MEPPYQKPDTLADAWPADRRARVQRFLREYEITLLTCVCWRNRPPWRLVERRQADSFFLFPTVGVLRLYCEGRQYRVPPGAFIMLRDRRPHAIELEDGHAALEQVSVHALIQNAWQAPLLSWFDEPVGRLRAPEEAFRQLRLITHLLGHDPAAAQVAGASFLRGLLIDQLLDRDDVTPDDSRADPRILRALHTIQERFGAALTVETLAAEADLSDAQFRKLFRRETGQSPQAYLHDLRLREAARALRHTSRPISRIAADCGFATPQYFHQCFRRAHACTPTDYRRAARGSV